MDTINIPARTEYTEEQIEKLHSFYTVRTKGGQYDGLQFDRLKIVERIRELGYVRYDQPDGSSHYVYLHDNKISLTTEQQIVDAFEDWVEQLPDVTKEVSGKSEDGEGGGSTKFTITGYKVKRELYKNLNSYFGKNLERLRPTHPIELCRDTRCCKYFFFRNTALAVDRDGFHEVPYTDLQGMIWESSIMNRDWHYSDRVGDFEQFVQNIAGNQQRKASLMSMLGYLMHDHYECDLRAVLLTDEASGSDGKDAGRTGKGLLGKALGEMLNRTRSDCKYVAIGGKNFDVSKDTRYSLADMTTQLIHLEDVNKNFNLEDYYNDITDGASLRKPYQVTPTVRYVKFMLSTNATIDVTGSSKRGRLLIFELLNYYSDKHRPADDFGGKRFFDSDWSEGDWDEFYSFMVRCELEYLTNGVREPEELNYAVRRLEEQTNESFLGWFDDTIKYYVENQQHYEFEKQWLYNSFVQKYPEYADPQKYKRAFGRWCGWYLDTYNIPYCSLRKTQDVLVLYPTTAEYQQQREQQSRNRNRNK